jgi:hypothetical protein
MLHPIQIAVLQQLMDWLAFTAGRVTGITSSSLSSARSKKAVRYIIGKTQRKERER